jgi:hypothetical protein
MKVYHASPNHNIKNLFDNSYVSLYPHIAYYMGLYYTDTNKTWTDCDLKEPYLFSDKIKFKPNKNQMEYQLYMFVILNLKIL